jgi:hypothetical protein
VNAKGAIFYLGTAGSISSGNLIDLDLKSATFAQAALVSTGLAPGTADRDKIVVPLTLAPGATILTFGAVPLAAIPPFPTAVAAGYTATYTPTAVPGAAQTLALTARSATGFTANIVGAGGVAGDLVITRSA